MSTGRLPIIAIVGRPNVGKSTLFNRILGERKALVHDRPGMTRDRHYGRAQHANKPFILIDTGGYEDSTDSPMLRLMREQSIIAIEEADRIIFLTEESVPSDPIDAEIIQRLRMSGKPFFLAVNKADNQTQETQAIADFSMYGLDTVYPVSALHGRGILDLLDDVTEGFSTADPTVGMDRTGPIRVAIVGRQNAGKSTLTNRLLGQNRMIASDEPGTTRDSIDSEVEVEGQPYTLIDTAGIRRRGKIERGAEKLSVHSSFSAIERAEVALLIVDISEGVTTQDLHIAGYTQEAGRSLIIVLNKWDTVADRENYGAHIKKVREEFKAFKWAPIITISAMTGQRAHKLWGLIQHCAEQYRREFQTAELNRVLKQAMSYLSPPIVSGKQLRIKYVTQTGYCPPALTFFMNDPKLMHFSYERFLQNQFRMHLAIDATPLRFRYKKKMDEWEDVATRRREARASQTPEEPVAIDIDDDFEAEFFQEDGEEQ
ncbi:MAG: GTPase [Candidatus Sumerlaeota bacterium]|nr:GTPase [Candidatus Sumerlaeota bacterium]